MKIFINRRIEVLWNNEFYRSTVQDSKSNSFVISIPMKGSEYLPISVGQSVEMHYYEGDSIYKFEGEVIDRENKGMPLLTVKIPQTFKKIQRRKYVRVPVTTSVKYMVTPKEYRLRRLDNTTINNMNQGILVDLSGGGLKFVSNESLKDKSLLVQMKFDSFELIAKGEVVRCIFDEKERVYDIGMNFTDIGAQEREKLITYIFRLMREQIRKS